MIFFDRLSTKLFFRIILLFVGLLFSASTMATAQQISAEALPDNASPNINDQISVAVNVDMSQSTEKLGSYSASLTWDPAILEYIGYSGGSSAPFTDPTVNDGNVASGVLSFSDASSSGGSGVINTINVQLKAISGGTSALDLEYSAMAAALTFVNLLPNLTVNDGSVTIPSPNTAPTATNVHITGTAVVDQLLTGNYTYFDAEGDSEGTSTFRWLRDDSPISGATSQTYQLVAADENTMIKFEVTPVAQTGESPGTPVQSDAVGPVTRVKSNQPSNQRQSGRNIFLQRCRRRSGKRHRDQVVQRRRSASSVQRSIDRACFRHSERTTMVFHRTTKGWPGFRRPGNVKYRHSRQHSA